MSDINFSNENYLKEMEKNARLFEEKMNKLEQVRLNNMKNNENTQKMFKKQDKTYNNFSKNYISNKNKSNIYEQSNNNYQEQFYNNFDDDNDQDNNYEIYDNSRQKKFKENANNERDSFNKNEIIQYKKKIEQLKNEINDKDKTIKRLENALKEKESLPSLKQYEEINNICENLKVENNTKTKTIKGLENENKELKNKIDSLVDQIKNMKEVIQRKTDEIENMKMNIESLKEEILINNKKMNNLELQNKKLNIEYENLNKDFQIIKNEKIKLNLELEEQKATIFNYQKELSLNNKRNSKSNNKHDYGDYNYLNKNNLYDQKYDYIKGNSDIHKEKHHNDDIYEKRNNYQNDYVKDIAIKYEEPQYSDLSKENNFSNKTGAGLRKKNYTKYDLESFNASKKTNIPLADLESRLSYLISEKKKLENELLKMPEHPRNLNEIKIKKDLNNKITETEQEINKIRTKIRNFEY